jgi:hypothetical protein
MSANAIKKYIRFIKTNSATYFHFNKQLFIGEIAGFGAGVGIAEAAAALSADELTISLSSGVVDYAGSILGFFAIFYYDKKPQYRELDRNKRFKHILKDVFSLWPSIAAADIAYIVIRPYLHYLLLVSSFEVGIAATIAHFAAFGVFNGVAILSRSIIDYMESSKQQ